MKNVKSKKIKSLNIRNLIKLMKKNSKNFVFVQMDINYKKVISQTFAETEIDKKKIY